VALKPTPVTAPVAQQASEREEKEKGQEQDVPAADDEDRSGEH
jgi:hypothetical protein